jgi:hypothetical protein
MIFSDLVGLVSGGNGGPPSAAEESAFSSAGGGGGGSADGELLAAKFGKSDIDFSARCSGD